MQSSRKPSDRGSEGIPVGSAPRKRFRSWGNLVGLVLALLVIFGFFCWQLPSFPTVLNIETLLRQSVTTILVSLGLTYVIISAGIDLSVGSVAAFSCVVVAFCLKAGWPPLLSGLSGIMAGLLAGLMQGVLITQLRVVPFIVTLGGLSLFRGAAKGLGHQQSIYPPPSWLDNILEALGKTERWKLFPIGVWITLALAAIMGLGLRYTRFGRHVVAVGSNENAARLCGVPINRVKISVYVISGIFAGLAGLMFYSRESIGDPTIAVGLELDGIAAAVIGGASLNGGEGSILGSVLGALIMQTLRSGASQMGLQDWIQEIVTGVIIVMAVALDRFRKKV